MSDRALRDVQDTVRDACASSTGLRIMGAGTWLQGGRPVRASATVSTRALTGVIAYVPDDLVITVGAGTTLEELAAVTAGKRQWLPLDPPGSDASTIGAAVATASSGPLALGVGRVRDLVLGLESISGEGTRIRAGGRVVKNVAGFDLVRLATGAWGTLGVITEVSLRLYARPAVDETYRVSMSAGALAELEGRLGLASLSFLALELLDAESARAALGDAAAEWTLLARIGGNRARVDALRARLAALGAPEEVPGRAWSRLRTAQSATAPDDDAEQLVARVSDRPARLIDTLRAVRARLDALGVTGQLRVTPHSGTVRVTVAHAPSAAGLSDSLVEALRGIGASTVFEQLPARAWGRVPGTARDPISRRIRDAFDPGGILNPGILGELDPAAPRPTTDGS